MALVEANADRYFAACAYFLLGRAALLMKDNSAAYDHLTVGLRLCRTHGLGWATSMVLTELGLVSEGEDRLAEALTYYEQALADAAAFADLWSYQRTQVTIGRIQLAMGRVDVAVDTQLSLLRALTRNPVTELHIDSFVEIAQILICDGKPQLAAALLEVCAAHPECFQPTRDRALDYLTALQAEMPTLDVTTARNLLPTSKAEIAKLLLDYLTAGRQ